MVGVCAKNKLGIKKTRFTIVQTINNPKVSLLNSAIVFRQKFKEDIFCKDVRAFISSFTHRRIVHVLKDRFAKTKKTGI